LARTPPWHGQPLNPPLLTYPPIDSVQPTHPLLLLARTNPVSPGATNQLPFEYRVEVATDAGFLNSVASGVAGPWSPTLSRAYALQPALASAGPYYWRARAVHPSGMTSAWSSVGRFTISNAARWYHLTITLFGCTEGTPLPLSCAITPPSFDFEGVLTSVGDKIGFSPSGSSGEGTLLLDLSHQGGVVAGVMTGSGRNPVAKPCFAEAGISILGPLSVWGSDLGNGRFEGIFEGTVRHASIMHYADCRSSMHRWTLTPSGP
jgi:hypothetical protein